PENPATASKVGPDGPNGLSSPIRRRASRWRPIARRGETPDPQLQWENQVWQTKSPSVNDTVRAVTATTAARAEKVLLSLDFSDHPRTRPGPGQRERLPDTVLDGGKSPTEQRREPASWESLPFLRGICFSLSAKP